MADPLPALIAAGRAASEGATEGWVEGYNIILVGEPSVHDKTKPLIVSKERARHIAAHPPAVTRALWDAVEALVDLVATIDREGLAYPRDVGKATRALARLRALAESGR